MTKKRLGTIAGLVLIGSVILSGCYKKRLGFDKIAGGEWNPEIAAPLINSRLTMKHIMEGSTQEWKENPDGLISFIYHGRTESSLTDTLLNIPDQKADTTLSVSLPPSMIPGDSTSKIFNVNARIKGKNNELLDSVFFKTGIMEFTITTNLNHNAKVQVIIPGLAKYGVTFIQTINVPKSISGSFHTVKASFPVNLYTATFSHPNGNDNEIEQYYKVQVNFGPQTNNSPYTLKIEQKLSKISYYNAFGYFGQHTFSIDKAGFDIDLFNNHTISEIFLEDPRLNLKFINSFGFPANVHMDEFYVENNGATKDMVSTLLPDLPVNASPAPLVFDTSEFVFDKNNSNIIDLFNFQPKKVYFKETVTSNPSGNQIPNFILDTSKVYVHAELELPLYGRTLEFMISDSADYQLERDEGVQSADVRINLSNMFPVEANAQIYLTDTNGVVLDSLLDEDHKLLAPALVGPAPDYRTSEPLNQTTVVTFKGARLDNLWNARRAKFRITLSTVENGQKVVKIYSDYYIDIKLAVKLNYLTEI